MNKTLLLGIVECEIKEEVKELLKEDRDLEGGLVFGACFFFFVSYSFSRFKMKKP